MPKYRRYGRFAKPRTSRRYGRPRPSARRRGRYPSRGRVGTSIVGRAGFAPVKKVMSFRYATTKISTDTSPATYSRVLFRTNSLYDPDNATGGHQPMYFDQLGALYDRYSVLSSKIVVSFQATPGATVPCLVWIRPLDVPSTQVADPDTIREQYGVRTKLLTTQWPNTKLSMGWNCKSIMSVSDNTASWSQNPTEQRYWEFGIMSTDGSPLTLGDYQMNIVITYKAMLSARKDVVQS